MLFYGQIVSVNSRRRTLSVAGPSGQVLGIPIRVLHYGAADPLRIDASPLPKPGTWGLVAIPGNDNRNAVWIGAVLTSLEDANGAPNDPDADYQSHASGAWELLTGAGEWTKALPDGSYMRFGQNPAKPQLTRHTVDQNQVQQATAYPDSARTNGVVASMAYRFQHASGTTQDITPGGQYKVTTSSQLQVNAPAANFSGNVSVGTGATGTYSAGSGLTLSFKDGICVNIA